ncbi:MAG: CocE/NonD family hydrolase [Acidobacteriota bacterium]
MSGYSQARKTLLSVLLSLSRFLSLSLLMILGLSVISAEWSAIRAAPLLAEVSQPQYEWIVEKDVDIPMRDGALLKANIFRPASSRSTSSRSGSPEKFPIIMNLGPYEKDKLWVPPPDLEEAANEYMNWETGNPPWWCPRGYILIRVDSRGSGKSPGYAEVWSQQEAVDFYDAIEWAGVQPWSNGNVGLLGISYYAVNQWTVAGLQPPHLKAIIPWEGFSDLYRDATYHGGIYYDFFTTWYTGHTFNHLHGPAQIYNPDAMVENWVWKLMRNRMDTGWYDGRRAEYDKIVVPLYSAGNWAHTLHLRGNTEGYVRSASPHKKLRIHMGTHYHPFYSKEGRMDQLRFFDYWLKGIDTGIMAEPPVKACARTGPDECEWRFNQEWPFDNTQWTQFYLRTPSAGDGNAAGGLTRSAPANGGVNTYASQIAYRSGPTPEGVSFVTEPMAQDVEVIGPVNLVMWVSSTTDDMYIFATVRNIAPNGEEVTYTPRNPRRVRVPAAVGWLKVSHRKLDPQLSTPYRPYHAHDEEQKLKPGEIVKVEVEIWPTGTVFKKGHRIQLDIAPTDSEHRILVPESLTQQTNSIYTGGDRASYLLLPIIPSQQGASRMSRGTAP